MGFADNGAVCLAGLAIIFLSVSHISLPAFATLQLQPASLYIRRKPN